MKSKRIYKLLIFVIIAVTLIVVVRQNVTLTKEPRQQDTKAVALEIKSDMIQNVYSKLTLLKDSFSDEGHRDIYFDFDKEKILSSEDKLYIAFDSLYKKDSFQKEKLSESKEKLTIDKDTVKNEIKELFKEENFDLNEITFTPSKSCGIVEYNTQNEQYELIYNQCEDTPVKKVKIENAYKEGNFINLKIKSFYIQSDKEQKDNFLIKDFKNDSIIVKMTKEELNNNIEQLFENMKDTYTFSFELKGDEYYLYRITREWCFSRFLMKYINI